MTYTYTSPIITSIIESDNKRCNACRERDTSKKFYEIRFGQSVIAICQTCADTLKASLPSATATPTLEQQTKPALQPTPQEATATTPHKATELKRISTFLDNPLLNSTRDVYATEAESPQGFLYASRTAYSPKPKSKEEASRTNPPTKKDYDEVKTVLADFLIETVIPKFATIAQLQQFQRTMIANRTFA